MHATFFVNSKEFVEMDVKNPDQTVENANNLVRMVTEGHILADHSYDHMSHNSQGPKEAYQNFQNDIR